jgi:hypothetical protein
MVVLKNASSPPLNFSCLICRVAKTARNARPYFLWCDNDCGKGAHIDCDPLTREMDQGTLAGLGNWFCSNNCQDDFTEKLGLEGLSSASNNNKRLDVKQHEDEAVDITQNNENNGDASDPEDEEDDESHSQQTQINHEIKDENHPSILAERVYGLEILMKQILERLTPAVPIVDQRITNDALFTTPLYKGKPPGPLMPPPTDSLVAAQKQTPTVSLVADPKQTPTVSLIRAICQQLAVTLVH